MGLLRLCFPAAEVERFLNETEEYINKLTKKLVQYKAEEQAGEAVQEAIAEVSGLAKQQQPHNGMQTMLGHWI